METMQNAPKTEDIGNQQDFSLWILYSFFAPIAIPYILVKTWRQYKATRAKNALLSKVVLITGASSGIGEALAHVFYKKGCRLVLSARREVELNRVREELLATESMHRTYTPLVLPLDLGNLDSIPKKVANLINSHGGIDILVNNGGISVRADVKSTAIDVDVKVMTTNYFGAVALTKAVLPSMLSRKQGKIVFISSVQGKFAIPFRSAYSASKHALQAFADSLRAEVAGENIDVVCISPGYVNTSLSVNALTGDGMKYGVMDASTKNGFRSDAVAKKIVESIIIADKDVILAQPSAIFAYWLRFLCPSLYFLIMRLRASKPPNS